MLLDEKILVALFDLDGVVIDTESQYSVLWDSIGLQYLGIKNFGNGIKGQSLTKIFDEYFNQIPEKHTEIEKQLDDFEAKMEMPYIAGFKEFIAGLREKGIKTAVVTSSNKLKMESVYKKQPELKDLFDRILTAEQFKRSKPFPDPYILGAEIFGVNPENCVVFEDSFNGLKSGKAAGMKVIGLATTNPAEDIKPFCDIAISDYKDFSLF